MRYRKVWGANGPREYVDGVLVSGEEPQQPAAAMFMRDIEQHYGEPIISPVDGSVISSRSQLREHNIRHNVRQNGDFKPGEIVSIEKARRGYDPTPSKEVSFKWI